MDSELKAGFSLVEGFFAAELSQFQLIGSIVGAVIVLCGLAIVCISLHFWINGERVTLKVIKHHVETRRAADHDDFERAEDKRQNPNIRLEFRLQDGPNVGSEVKASSAGSTVEHDVGELVPGYYFPSSMDVMSRAQTATGIKFGLIFAALGLGFVTLVNFMAAQW